MKDAENLKVYPNFDTKFPESPLLQTFIAELAVPIPGKGEPFMAIGKGRNKGEAERMCCYAACEKLHEEGFLDKQGIVAGSPASSFTKVYQSQQVMNCEGITAR